MIENNKTVIITGANKGIGLATTKKFFENNYNVIFCTRQNNIKKLNDKFNLSDDFKKRIIPIKFDLNNENTILDAAKEITDSCLKIDALINNAGTIQTKLFSMTRIDEIKEMFNINFFSNLLFTQKISKIFMKQKKGNIINISSTAAQDPVKGRLAYASVKSSIDISSKILSKELAPFNIRVNSVAPGLTDTDLMRNNHKRENIEDTIKKLSLKKIATPQEIANIIYFLTTDESSYITGQVIRVDGGM